MPKLIFQCISEVAIGGAFHDGLRPFELYFGIETFNKRIISAAGKTVTKLSNAQSLVTLDVKTAGDVKGLGPFIVFQHIFFQDAAFSP